MQHAKRFHMKIIGYKIGVGGWNCACCAPAPGKRAKLWRSAKRREREIWKREVAKELGD